MELYDRDLLREMCSQVDLLEYASQTMQFHRRGQTYATNCPKHIDKTPSLVITPEKNMFHCFSCGLSGDIISWMRKIEGLSFNDAVTKLSAMTNTEIKQLKQCESLQFYKKVKRMVAPAVVEKVQREILSDEYLEQFSTETPREWVDEGISSEVMKRFNIRIDNRSNRIVYPVYDNNDNLIGVKGRTRYANYKDMGIQKYQYYKKIGSNNFFVGMKENRQDIINEKEVVIFEGIKSVMKYETQTNKRNALAAETSCLNDDQIKILVSMGIKNVVIAFDSDVSLDKIKGCSKLLNKFLNVYCIHDKHGLLGEKMSPVDNGVDAWRKLYEERIKL